MDLPEPPSNPPAPSNRAKTSFAAHVLCYGSLAVALVWGLGVQWRHAATVPAESRAQPARFAEVQTRIDPNVADWSELVRLPGIGETLAKRIVAYRQQEAVRMGQEPVFSRLEDLDAVRGIGPKTLAKMADYLSFPGPADGSTSQRLGPGGVDTSAQRTLK